MAPRSRRSHLRSAAPLANPLFPRPRLRLPGPVADLAILSVATVAFIVLSLLPTFRVTTIEVRGQQRLNPAYVVNQVRGVLAERRFGLLPMSSYFYLPTDAVEQQLRSRLAPIVPLASIGVHKRFPRTLIVELTEQRPALLLKIGQRHFTLDANGTVTGEGSADDAAAYPSLEEVNGLPVTVGDALISPLLTVRIPELKRALEERGLAPVTFSTPKVQCPFSIAVDRPSERPAPEVSNANAQANVNATPVATPEPIAQSACDLRAILRASTEVHATTGEGWTIRLDTIHETVKVADALTLTLEKKISSRQSLEYIDLRYLPKVFFR